MIFLRLAKTSWLISLSEVLFSDNTGLRKIGWPIMPSEYSPLSTGTSTVFVLIKAMEKRRKVVRKTKKAAIKIKRSFLEKDLKI